MLVNYNFLKADDFEYHDPIDGSISKNQVKFTNKNYLNII